MFEPSRLPRLFGLPPGADFPAELVRGLAARVEGQPPEALARVELFVNTARMQRRLGEIFAAGPARLLPRIRLITELGNDAVLSDLPPPVPVLRRRLELARLVSALLERDPTVAPRTAAYDLADSLAALMDEMQGEGVAPDALAALDVSDTSGHWTRALDFIRIVQPWFEAASAPDPEARQRRAVEALVARWKIAPPTHPIVVAGSTGSRGTTALLLRAVARLVQGAVVLPGVDFDMPAAVWDRLTDALSAEDHPQFRFAGLAEQLEMAPGDIVRWTDAAPVPARNRLVSMALRPAPVTDQWMHEGPELGDLLEATDGLSLMEAPDSRIEALAIALRLRHAVEEGRRAALITPDRTLTRQVTAELDRWRIEPDDSAGRPLSLSAPGRLLRQVSAVMGRDITPEALLSLLKHPLVQTGHTNRGAHLRHTRMLELWLRREARPTVGHHELSGWAEIAGEPAMANWVDWLGQTIFTLPAIGGGTLEALLAAHVTVTEALASGMPGAGAGELWDKEAGRVARAVFDELMLHADAGGPMSLTDYVGLIEALLRGKEVRDPILPHPDVLIWGTLEARVQGADLVILGGLSDGIWPEAPAADPWLNRAMRHQAGLLLPERRIGLSAHDFQQAIGAPEVMMTRALRDGGSETVPSRWLSRLQTLLSGLPAANGPAALDRMRQRGAGWLALARALDERRVVAPRAPRPSPAPPIDRRPARLSVTEIQKLVRDPYSVYARRVLGLTPLDPLRPEPTAATKGTVIHAIFEEFVRDVTDPSDPSASFHLREIAERHLAGVPWAASRAIWRAAIRSLSDWFVAGEAERRKTGAPLALEATGGFEVPGTGVTLKGKADRIDRLEDGRLRVLDYKTGKPPTEKQIDIYDPQLMIEAVMIEAGAFDGIPAETVSEVGYVGLGSNPSDALIPLRVEAALRGGGKIHTFDPDASLQKLQLLLMAYADPGKGYTARRAMETLAYDYGYDDLARYGEWDESDMPTVVPLR